MVVIALLVIVIALHVVQCSHCSPLPLVSAADQVYGDQEMHSVVRNHCLDYMVRRPASSLRG